MKALPRFVLDDPIPTRYSLLSRLQNRDDHESWKDFFDTYWRLIFGVAVKAGLTEAEAQDVVQETVICVARDLEKFKRNRELGSFKGWLRNIVRWRIADQFEKREMLILRDGDAAEEPVPDLDEIPSTESVLESHWDEEWRANLFDAAIDRVKRQVREEHYQIFHLHIVKGWPVVKVARALSVRVGQVYLIKHRISGLVKKEIQMLEKKLF